HGSHYSRRVAMTPGVLEPAKGGSSASAYCPSECGALLLVGVSLHTFASPKEFECDKNLGHALPTTYRTCSCDFAVCEPADFPLRYSVVADDRHRFSKLLRLSVGRTSRRAADRTLQSALV